MTRPPLTASSLGDRIREARTAAGFRRRSDFASAVGAGYMTVYDWERGKYRPRSDYLQAIATATGYSETEILGSDERPEHEALEDFLDTPFAADLTDAELAQLRAYPWSGRPTVQTYHFMLLALRAQLTPDEAARAARVTEAAQRRAEEAGVVEIASAKKRRENRH